MIAKAKEQQFSPNYIIDVSKPFHVSWWAATLGATEQDLIRAVNAVGARAIEVSYYLRQEGVRSVERRSHHRLHARPNEEEMVQRAAVLQNHGRAGRGSRRWPVER